MTTKQKTLKRMPKQGQIFGVCAGLAEYFDMDVTLVRVIFVVLIFATGGGMILLYLVLALVLPSDDSKINQPIDQKVEILGEEVKTNQNILRMRDFFGIGMILLGIWLLLIQFFPQLFSFRWDYVWPIILVLVGILIIIKRK